MTLRLMGIVVFVTRGSLEKVYSVSVPRVAPGRV